MRRLRPPRKATTRRSIKCRTGCCICSRVYTQLVHKRARALSSAACVHIHGTTTLSFQRACVSPPPNVLAHFAAQNTAATGCCKRATGAMDFRERASACVWATGANRSGTCCVRGCCGCTSTNTEHAVTIKSALVRVRLPQNVRVCMQYISM